MKYIDIYNSIENPLTDEALKALGDIYKESKTGYSTFYSCLVQGTRKKSKSKYNKKDHDEFYIKAFNKWKNGIASLTKEEIKPLIERGSYDDRIYKLSSYLKKVPDFTSVDEIKEIISGKKTDDDEIKDALIDFNWTDEFGYWRHVKSRYLNGKRGHHINVDHRLYLNLERTDIYKVANEFVKKCDGRNIPYYFKFNDFASRDDSLVVYSDTERLPLYVEVLQEIAKENPDLRKRCQTPPLLTGKIDGWIGYGSEPSEKNGKNRSFNEVRSNCIDEAMTQTLKEWVQQNKNSTINYQGQNITIADFLTLSMVESKIEKMKEAINYKGKKYTQKEYEDRMGYDVNYVSTPDFKKRLYAGLKPEIEKYLKDLNSQPNTIKYKLRNNKETSFSPYLIMCSLGYLTPYLMRNDTIFRNKVRENIKTLSEKEGIDTSKYCFDVNGKNKLIEQDNKNRILELYYKMIKESAEKHSLNIPRMKNHNETVKDYMLYLRQFLFQFKKQTGVNNNSSTENNNSQQKPADDSKEQNKSKTKIYYLNPNIDTKSTYRLKKNEIIQDLPINSKQETRYNQGMSDEAIKESQNKINEEQFVKVKKAA